MLLPKLGRQQQTARKAAVKLAHELSRLTGEPMAFSGTTFRITASIGIRTFPNKGSTHHDILRTADIAEPGVTPISTAAMGDALLHALDQAAA